MYIMALSPDARLLAVGGRMSDTTASLPCCGDIRLFDLASGRQIGLLKGHQNAVVGLAFSPDSRLLLSGSFDNTAIIWDIETRSVRQHLKGHTGFIFGAAFTPDGERAITGSFDHDLRMWRVADGQLMARMTGHRDMVRSIAIAKDGTIASGDAKGEIRLWNGNTGTFQKVLAQQIAIVGSLTFSPDGRLLLSTSTDTPPTHCHVYDLASAREIVTYLGHDNSVVSSAISHDGRWAATGGGSNQEIHIWSLKTGDRRLGSNGQALTLAGNGKTIFAVGFGDDGQEIAWGTKVSPQVTDINELGPLQYALRLPATGNALLGPRQILAAEANTFHRAAAKYSNWSLRLLKGGKYNYNATLEIEHAKRPVARIERDETNGIDHRSFSFTPDGETIISGGGFAGWIAAYDRAGKELGTFAGHESGIFALAASPDGKYLVSGAYDQTVRLWNLKTRELLVTIFRGEDGEWVMFTPQGYFAASPAGAGLIGWQINHGPENAAEYVTAAQLRKSLNRPDIVAKAIQLASAEEAVKQSAGTNFKLSDLLAKPVPRFRIVSPAANATLAGGTAQLELALEDTSDPVNLIRLYVNGMQVEARQPEDGPGFKPGPLAFTVPLAKGRNLIRAVAVNGTGETSVEVAVDLARRRRARQARHTAHPGHRRGQISGPRQGLPRT